ncbi:MAG: hypothetical protein WDA27_01860 [Actinomycetota bacterium]
MATPTSPDTRYRCGGCGNLTRFDVEARRHTRQYLHYSLGGDPSIEEEEIIGEEIVRVTCRWCGSAEHIEVVQKVPTQ